jgi:hypothetical protein
MDSLKKQIKALRCESPRVSLRSYIPHNSLKRLLKQGIIQSALKGHVNSYQLEQIEEKVIRDGVKIFAVLVLADDVASILRFIEEDLLQDVRLPFELSVLEDKVSLPSSQKFFKHQWEVSSPQFFRGTLTRSLDKRTLLPFVKDDRIAEGGFGDIYEIEFHPDHQDLEPCFKQRVNQPEWKTCLYR